nr:growth-regulating factor 4 isoform X4 [Solanum lycopersicum]
MSMAAENGYRPPFTAVQWQELEHQAMIYKYLVAGIPVPADLVVPIRRSFEPISARFFHHPSLGYCSYYGKKFDPEPGRCRRTDGKKWRCAKDAYPDSKYCERHMHRGRNRSRKHVESQSTAQSLLTSMSHNTTGSTTGSSKTSGNFQRNSSESFQNTPLYSAANSEGPSYGSATTKMQMEPPTYAIDSKGYFHGMTADADEQNFSLEASEGTRSLGQHQHCFFSSDIGSPGTVKQEQRSMRPFFDEWPTTKESWSNLDDEGSNKNNFSTTQLSISIPMAPPDFSSRSSCSPNDA